MDLETACKEIDKAFAENWGTDDELNILLMGGEPFIEFDLIRQIVDYVRSDYKNQKVVFKAVTNGTLVHGEIQDWLLANSDIFKVELSLDGFEADHNKFRSNSYSQIDFSFFSNLSKSVVSTVIIPETLGKLSGNIIFLSEKGYTIKSVIADGVDWSADANAEVLAKQLMLLIEYYLKHPQKYPFNLLSLATYCVDSSFSLPKCSPGFSSKAVAADGTEHACHRCSAYYNTGEWKIPAEDIDLKEIEYLNDACKNCCVKDICNTCPASIASVRNHKEQSEMSCRFSKILFYANAYFHIRLLTECPDHIFFKNRDTKQKRAMLNGSQYILKHLNPEVAF